MAAAISWGVGLDDKIIPVLSFWTESIKPDTPETIAGVPQAAHSVTVIPHPSLAEGKTSAQACCFNLTLTSPICLEKYQTFLSLEANN